MNQYIPRCFLTILPPSRVTKLTELLPGPLPRPLKVITMRLYSEKGVSPGTKAWLWSPGKVSVCLSPKLFFKFPRLRRRHKLIYIGKKTQGHPQQSLQDIKLCTYVYKWENAEKVIVLFFSGLKSELARVKKKDRMGWEKQTFRARSGPFLLSCV